MVSNIDLDTIYEVVERLEKHYVIGAITSVTTGEVKDIEMCNDEDILDAGTFICNAVEAYEARGYEFSYDSNDMLVFSLSDLMASNILERKEDAKMLDAAKMPNLFNLLSLADVIDPATKIHDEDSDTDVDLVPLLRAAADEVAALGNK